jgi:single-stranded-DNA-specific exonuclease
VSLQRKRWRMRPVPLTPPLEGVSPLLVRILGARGVTNPTAVLAFLEGDDWGANPFELKGMPEAITRLRQAIRGGERVAIYGDFDTDGVTATALLTQTLRLLDTDVRPYIPDRVDEGYGLNLDALHTLRDDGVRLVITVDCGIRSVAEVERAPAGLDLIVTDHHSVGQTLPPAVALIDPKQPGCSYPFEKLAGVGVAFKLAQALLMTTQRVHRQALPLDEGDLLDLVALGTVADLAPLVGENRSLVQRGLARLNAASRPGVAALMAEAGLRRGSVTAESIAFALGPRINAAGRMARADAALDLLLEPDPLRCRELAARLGELNHHRQQATADTVERALAQITDPTAPLLIAGAPDFPAGIVGLVASRLTEAFYRPSVVVEEGVEECRASCRSIPTFHITHALDRCADLLVRHGGHEAAAGFTARTENLPALRERLTAIASEVLADRELVPELAIDAELELESLSPQLLTDLDKLEPTGEANPAPVFLTRDVEVHETKAIGSEDAHLKLTLRDHRKATWDAIGFRRGDQASLVPDRIDVAYTLRKNAWNGQAWLQLVIEDLRPATDVTG